MNWIAVAITDLREYKKRKRFLENVDSQLIWLENDFAALKGCATDSEAVDGGSSKNEDHLLSKMCIRDRMKYVPISHVVAKDLCVNLTD